MHKPARALTEIKFKGLGPHGTDNKSSNRTHNYTNSNKHKIVVAVVVIIRNK